MRLSGCLPPPPRELCSRMHGSISTWALPHTTPHLLVLILSCSLPVQPALSQLVFSTRPEDGAGVLGVPLTLHCAVFDSRQQRALTVRWERARGEPPAGTLHPVDIHHLANGSLFFPQLRERHLGRYVCAAGTGADRISTVVQVEKAGLEAVFFSPQAQTVSEGEGVFLQCVSGDSSPPAHITWLKDGTLVTTGRQIQGQYGGGNQRKTSGTLHLSNVTLEDEGTYVCLTHNPLLSVSRESRAAKLTVLGIPRRLQITQGPDNITVAVATEAFMHCAAIGFPVPMVHWFKDRCLLTNRSGSFSFQNNGQLLIFRNVSEEDEGHYHCEASNQKETVKSQPAFLLPAVMGWSFAKQPTNQTVKRGEKATLVCRSPHSRPPAQVSWFRNNQLLTPKAHFTVMSSGDLFFHSVQASDSGTYFCRASNSYLHQSVTSRRVTLTVLAPPSVKLWPQAVTVPVDAQVVLQCQVWGHPPPSISWFKQGRSMQTGGKISVGVRNTTLYILSVKSYDEGRYTCEASNTLGRDHSTATLRVTVSPIIVSFAGRVSSRVGASVVLLCRAVGVLPITYTWTKGRGDTFTSITSNEEMHIDDDGTLHISSVRWSDGGKYHCMAENRAGRQQRSTMLTITAEDDPADSGKQTRLNLSASNNIEKEQLKLKSNDSEDEQHSWTTNHPHIHKRPSSHKVPTTHRSVPLSASSRETTFGLKWPPVSPDNHSQPPSNQPMTKPTQPIVTQMQPPLYLNIQPIQHQTQPPTQPPLASSPSVLPHSQPPPMHNRLPPIKSPLFVTSGQYLLTQSQSQTVQTSSGTDLYHQVIDQPTKPAQLDVKVSDLRYYLTTMEPLTLSLPSQTVAPPTQTTTSYLQSELSFIRPSASPMQAPEFHTQTILTQAKIQQSNSVTLSSPSQTKPQLSEGRPAYKTTQFQPLPTVSQPSQTHPQQSFTQTHFPQFQLLPSPTRHYPHSTQPQPSPNQGHPSQTQRSTQQIQFEEEPSPAQPQPPFTTSTLSQTQPHSPPAQYHPLHTQPPLLQTEPHSPPAQYHPLHTQPPLLQTQPHSPPAQYHPLHTQPPLLQTEPHSPPAQYHPLHTQPPLLQTEPHSPPAQYHPLHTQPPLLQTEPHSPPAQYHPLHTQPPLLQTEPHSPPAQYRPPHTQPPLLQTEPHSPPAQYHPLHTQPPLLQTQPHSPPAQYHPLHTQPPLLQTEPHSPPAQYHPLHTQPPLLQTEPHSPPAQYHPLHTQPPLLQTEPHSPPAQYRPPHTQPPLLQTEPHSPPAQYHPLHTQPPLLQTQPHSPPAQYHPLHTQPSLLQTQPHSPQTQSRNPLILQPLISTINPPDLSSSPSTSDPKIPGGHEVTTANQTHQNASQQANPVQPAKSANDTEPTEWLTWNTSQSPMTSDDPRVTQQSPAWLPVLEKHDIPIVVGVGVSMAFIFITMGFYSLVQKNEPVPTSRAAQRNLGVPKRHAERRSAGRTYENRAFEDDSLVAVVEQSPNTSDTHARPPGPSLVSVQMEPTSGEPQQYPQPNLDDHSITVETYPEPMLDTQIDPSLEEDKGCSVSQPSIQLQCVEDWASAGGDNHVPLQDALPPPSPLLSRSPSPSPPPVRVDALHSSLTLQTTEPCGAPVHHSLSISHGNSPLLLSHHLSLGLTTVAVDVKFYPAATAAVAVATSAHINSVSSATSVTGPLFSSPLAHSHENNLSTPRMHQNK